jgi:hypothetical protein
MHTAGPGRHTESFLARFLELINGSQHRDACLLSEACRVGRNLTSDGVAMESHRPCEQTLPIFDKHRRAIVDSRKIEQPGARAQAILQADKDLAAAMVIADPRPSGPTRTLNTKQVTIKRREHQSQTLQRANAPQLETMRPHPQTLDPDPCTLKHGTMGSISARRMTWRMSRIEETRGAATVERGPAPET